MYIMEQMANEFKHLIAPTSADVLQGFILEACELCN